MAQMKNISLPRVYNLANQLSEEMSKDPSSSVQEISVQFAERVIGATTEMKRQLSSIHERWEKRRTEAVESPVNTFYEMNEPWVPVSTKSENIRLLISLMIVIRNEIENCESVDYAFGIIIWDFKRIMSLIAEFEEILNNVKDLVPLDLPRTNRPTGKEKS